MLIVIRIFAVGYKRVRSYNNFSPANFRKWLFRFMFLENKMPLQDILVTMNIPICNIVTYISDDEMIAGCTDRIGNGWINDNEWDGIYNINF